MAGSTIKLPEIYGLTGGMGSGKSTAARRFKDNGAFVVDADQVVHDLQTPGSHMLCAMAEILGDDILGEDGALNRQLVAERFFTNQELNLALKTAMNPAIFAEIENRVAVADQDDTIIFDVPLLDPAIKLGGRALSGVIVVDVSVEDAVRRLKEGRGIDETEALRRLSHQISRGDRLAFADFIIQNNGTLEELHAQVDEVWRRIRGAKFAGTMALKGGES